MLQHIKFEVAANLKVKSLVNMLQIKRVSDILHTACIPFKSIYLPLVPHPDLIQLFAAITKLCLQSLISIDMISVKLLGSSHPSLCILQLTIFKQEQFLCRMILQESSQEPREIKLIFFKRGGDGIAQSLDIT